MAIPFTIEESKQILHYLLTYPDRPSYLCYVSQYLFDGIGERANPDECMPSQKVLNGVLHIEQFGIRDGILKYSREEKGNNTFNFEKGAGINTYTRRIYLMHRYIQVREDEQN